MYTYTYTHINVLHLAQDAEDLIAGGLEALALAAVYIYIYIYI